MRSFLRRCIGRIHGYIQGPVSNFKLYRPHIAGKAGLEIGGPSAVFRPGNPIPIYSMLGTLDNCDFSDKTVWANHASDFVFSPGKPAGRSFFCEGSDLAPIAADSYDFLLSSHNLEHFANPVKALLEWKRVLRHGGALILVLPYYRNTFDHRRMPTPVDHMMDDFDHNVGEDDLTHLPEILEYHDRSLDPPSGSLENFRQRSLDNINNRCLHHHVFDEANSRELLTTLGFEVLTTDLASPFHLCILARI